MSIRKKIAATAVAVAALGAVALGTSPASASPGGCVWGTDACLYFNSNLVGAYNGDGGDDNYGQPGWYFAGCSNGGCAGGGVAVKNNAASVYDMNPSTVRIYYNSNWSGPYQDIAGYSWSNLNSTLKNNNASQWFL